MSRILERRFWLGEVEKRVFMDLVRRLERFSGVEVVAYCLMDNHFHLLLDVTTRPDELGEKELIDRVEALYGKNEAEVLKLRWAQAGERGHHAAITQEKERLMNRMYDLSIFMKELKQRFTQWFNKRNDRRGPLWEDRFKSVLVEGTPAALRTIATYIDLNPVRAGLCDDPKDYRWCGYGAAMGGDQKARKRLRMLAVWPLAPTTWGEACKRYRVCLFGQGEETGERKGFDKNAVAEVLEAGGRLSPFELMRCQVRYFSDGLALGSQSFLDQLFETNRNLFGPNRTSGARSMQFGHWDGLKAMRDLRRNPVSVPL